MGKCKYCGESAGFLSKKHKECELKYISAKEQLIQEIEQSIVSGKDLQFLSNKIETVSHSSFIKGEERNTLLALGFEKAVEKFLEDGVLSPEEEDYASEFIGHFSLSQEDLSINDSFNRVVKGSILREVMNGNIPEGKVQIDGALTFNLQKSEIIVWLFNDVDFFEQTTRTEFRGGSQGVSIKVAKGVYYRTGAFRGHPVKTEEMVYKGSGPMLITNKHIYFGGPKAFRTRFDKIVSFNPYEDGIGIQKDGVTAKPQVFKNLDGWFCYNLLSNLSQM